MLHRVRALKLNTFIKMSYLQLSTDMVCVRQYIQSFCPQFIKHLNTTNRAQIIVFPNESCLWIDATLEPLAFPFSTVCVVFLPYARISFWLRPFCWTSLTAPRSQTGSHQTGSHLLDSTFALVDAHQRGKTAGFSLFKC